MYDSTFYFTTMLTNAGLAIIDAPHDGREATVRELAEETDHSTAQVYRVVDE